MPLPTETSRLNRGPGKWMTAPSHARWWMRRGGGERSHPARKRLGVSLHQCAELLGAAGEPQVAQRLGVDGEDRGRRAVLRRHVAYGRPVLERHLRHARAVALDEFADDTMVPKQFGNGEDEVGRRSAFRELRSEEHTS